MVRPITSSQSINSQLFTELQVESKKPARALSPFSIISSAQFSNSNKSLLFKGARKTQEFFKKILDFIKNYWQRFIQSFHRKPFPETKSNSTGQQPTPNSNLFPSQRVISKESTNEPSSTNASASSSRSTNEPSSTNPSSSRSTNEPSSTNVSSSRSTNEPSSTNATSSRHINADSNRSIGWSPLHLAILGRQHESEVQLQTITSLEPARELISYIDELIFENRGNLLNYTPEGMNPLHLACQLGYLDWVQRILQSCWAPRDYVNASERTRLLTPLHIAVSNGHFEVVRYLITQGANVNARDNPFVQHLEGGGIRVHDQPIRPAATPLFLALQSTNFNIEIVQLLLQNRARLSDLMNENLTREMVDRLRAAGADFQQTEMNGLLRGENLLHLFIQNCAEKEINDQMQDALIAMIEAGVAMDQDGFRLETPFALACENGQDRFIAAMIDRGAPISHPTRQLRNPLPIQLYWDSEHATAEMTRYLIDAGRIANTQSFNILNEACCRVRNLEIIRTLLTDNSSPIPIPVSGTTPFHSLACNTYVHGERSDEIIRELVRRGISIDAQSQDGDTPIMMAYVRCNLDKIQALVRCGATEPFDPSIRTDEYSILGNMFGTIKTTMINSILQHNWGSRNNEELRNRKREILQRLIDGGVDPNMQDIRGNTALHIACHNADMSDIDYFLSQPNPPVDIRNVDGDTPLHMLFYSFGLVPLQDRTVAQVTTEIVDRLIRAGADVNARNNRNDTPLSTARRENAGIDLIQHLIRCGAR